MNKKQKNELWTAVAVLAIVLAIVFEFFLTPKQKQNILTPTKLFFRATPSDKQPTDQNKSKVKTKQVHLPILMYHHIGQVPNPKDKLRIDLTVSPENFEQQMSWLKKEGYVTIKLEDLLNHIKGKFKMPAKPIVITFDDGYQDVFDNAVPILQKYGFVGSFAIITQFPGIQYADNVYADWKTINSAKNKGMEIVSHTQDHFDGTNPKYNKKFILNNLKDSQIDLQKNLNYLPAPILVYPYGHYNSQYLDAVREAGFRLGLTTNYGKTVFFDKLLEIPRVRIHGQENIENFKRLLKE